MAPDATTEKIRDKNKSRFNLRQAVRSNPFMSEEASSGGKSRQQNKKLGKSSQKKNLHKNKGNAAHLLLLLAPFLRFLVSSYMESNSRLVADGYTTSSAAVSPTLRGAPRKDLRNAESPAKRLCLS